MAKDYDSNKQIAEFNESVFQLQRLHNNWLMVSSKRMKGDFNGTRWVLDSQEAELEFDAKRMDDDNPDEKAKKYMQKIKEVNEEIEDAYIEKNILKKRVKIYQALLKKEKVLREVQQDAGKGSRYRFENEDDLD